MAAVVLAGSPAFAFDKLSFDEKLEISRGLNAEYAVLRVALPRSKKALVYRSEGERLTSGSGVSGKRAVFESG